VGVDTRGGAILRSLKRLLVLHDTVTDADDDAWGGSLAGTLSASHTRTKEKVR
jgi:hypothetical protein